MLTYIARRILYSIPVLLATSFLSFTFITKSSDPLANLRANPRTNSPGILHHLAHVYHLDQSLPVRYWYWLQDVFVHKLGMSLLTSQPIWPDISVAIEHTLQIILLAQVIALVLGVAVGIYSAIRQYSPFDYAMTSVSFLGYAMPTFWLALILQILFVDIYLKWHVRSLLHLGPQQRCHELDVVDRPACSTSPCRSSRSPSSALRSTAGTCARRCWT